MSIAEPATPPRQPLSNGMTEKQRDSSPGRAMATPTVSDLIAADMRSSAVRSTSGYNSHKQGTQTPDSNRHFFHPDLLDVTQDAQLSHCPTFFGNLPNSSPATMGQLTPQRVMPPPVSSAPLSPRGNVCSTPPRSPRAGRTEAQGGLGSGLQRPQWKTEDIAKLEDELAQLRSAAQALPDVSAQSASYRSASQSGARTPPREPFPGSSPWKSLDAAELPSAQVARTRAFSGNQSSPRVTSMPAQNVQSCSSPRKAETVSDRRSDRQSDSPTSPQTPEFATTTNPANLCEAMIEIERLNLALRKAHQQIADLQNESKAAEAAHSRDVAAMAALLQQVTAEKAARLGKLDKTGSSLSTDDTRSLGESEAESLGERCQQMVGSLRK